MSNKKEIILGLVLTCFSVVFVICSGELVVRLMLHTDLFAIDTMQQAWRFADAEYDDDYWKLDYIFSKKEKAINGLAKHPKLGWAPKVTIENPLGIITTRSYAESDMTNAILMYGDSFIAGVTPDIVNRIPQQLDSLIRDRPVLNLGVSGYGIDQIYLRFLDTVENFQNPIVVVGVLTDDINRSALSFRGSQKPYFDKDGEELILRNIPVLQSTEEYLDRNPVAINSYFLRLFVLKARSLFARDFFDRILGYDQIERKKRDINKLILRAFKKKADDLGIPLFFVIFYSGDEFDKPNWREVFIKDTFDELDIDYFDTKDILKKRMMDFKTQLNDYYYDDNGHTNERGNRVIAQQLYLWLKKRQLSIP